MLKSNISFEISASGPDLKVSAFFDDVCFYQDSPTQDPVRVSYEFEDADDGEHELRIEVSGKLRSHTQLDEQGNIVSDRVVSVQDLKLDDISLGYIFTEHAKYHHDFNGTQSPTVERFFGQAGCNGKITFQFTTPVYLWLLENL